MTLTPEETQLTLDCIIDKMQTVNEELNIVKSWGDCDFKEEQIQKRKTKLKQLETIYSKIEKL